MENAIELYLAVIELVSLDRHDDAISLIEKERGSFGSEFIDFVVLIANGKSKYIQLSFFEGREEYMYAPCNQDSKESLVLKSVLTRLIYLQKGISGFSLETILNRAHRLFLLGNDSTRAIEKLFFYEVSASLYLECQDYRMNIIASMLSIRHFLAHIQDDEKWMISSLLRSTITGMLLAISKIDFEDKQFNDVLNSLIDDIFKPIGIKEAIFTVAECILENLSLEERREYSLSILSSLKSKNINTVWGENIIRALVYFADKKDEDFDRYSYYKALSKSVISEEFLYPHLLLLDYCIETQSKEQVHDMTYKMIENPVIPMPVKAYLKAFLGEFMNIKELLSEGMKDALDIFCKENNPIAMYVISTFSEDII